MPVAINEETQQRIVIAALHRHETSPTFRQSKNDDNSVHRQRCEE
jgi:hypothetical protein